MSILHVESQAGCHSQLLWFNQQKQCNRSSATCVDLWLLWDIFINLVVFFIIKKQKYARIQKIRKEEEKCKLWVSSRKVAPQVVARSPLASWIHQTRVPEMNSEGQKTYSWTPSALDSRFFHIFIFSYFIFSYFYISLGGRAFWWRWPMGTTKSTLGSLMCLQQPSIIHEG